MEKIKEKFETKPLFAHFLSRKPFLVLYISGFILFCGWIHFCYTISDFANFFTNQISIVIYVFLGPVAYILVKKVYQEFQDLFKKDPAPTQKWKSIAGFPDRQELAYLFAEITDFDKYRSEVYQKVNNNKAKIVSIILPSVLFILTLFLDYPLELHSIPADQPWFSIAILEYFSFMIYWVIIYALLLNIVWMIFTITTALLMVNRQKNLLQISQSINELAESYKDLEKNGLTKTEIALLDFSFKRFTAGLSVIAKFVLSLSLKIAVVGGFSTIPAFIYFILTEKIIVVWYGLCLFSCSLSVLVFVLGQYGAWRVWCDAKINSVKLLTAICSKITVIEHDPKILDHVKNKIQVDADCMNRTISSINQTATVTYTSSAIFKVVSANFLAFGPILIEQILIRMLLN